MVWMIVTATIMVASPTASPVPSPAPGLTQGTAIILAAVISAAIGAAVSYVLTERKAKHDRTALQQAHQDQIERLQHEARLQYENAVNLARQQVEIELEKKSTEARRAIADAFESIGDALTDMEKSVQLLCRFVREGRTITRVAEPFRFFEITYRLHYPLARFRVIASRYEDIKNRALVAEPVLRKLWYVLECIEATYLADRVLADTSPACAYSSADQDLNPEGFLSVLLIEGAKKSRLEVLRYAVLRERLHNGSLDAAFSNAQRVIERFSLHSTPVFWRILLAQVRLVHIFQAVRARKDSDLGGLPFERDLFDPRVDRRKPSDKVVFEQPLTAVDTYLASVLGERLRDVV